MSSAEETRATVSVFVGASVDGFIARPDDSLDFLDAGDEGGEGQGEDHGYQAFIATIDTLVMGRKTFEVVLGFGSWPYGKRRVVVLSSRPVDLSGVKDGVVEQMSGEPAEIVSRLGTRGARSLYVDGGVTIQRFLRAGLVDRLIVSRLPVLIGQGIPLFGMVQSEYRVRRTGA